MAISANILCGLPSGFFLLCLLVHQSFRLSMFRCSSVSGPFAHFICIIFCSSVHPVPFAIHYVHHQCGHIKIKLIYAHSIETHLSLSVSYRDHHRRSLPIHWLDLKLSWVRQYYQCRSKSMHINSDCFTETDNGAEKDFRK